MARFIPTREYLAERLTYNPHSGEFHWLPKPRNDRLTKSWNARYAGEKAGWIEEGYLRIRLDGVIFQAANLAWIFMTGAPPRGLVDHWDGISTNNAFGNLRDATRSQNNSNRRSYAASGLKGAYFVGGKWRSWVAHAGQVTRLGTFTSADAAHQAYVAAAREIHGEFARDQ